MFPAQKPVSIGMARVEPAARHRTPARTNIQAHLIYPPYPLGRQFDHRRDARPVRTTLPQLQQPPVAEGGGRAVGAAVNEDAASTNGDAASAATPRWRLAARLSLRVRQQGEKCRNKHEGGGRSLHSWLGSLLDGSGGGVDSCRQRRQISRYGALLAR